MGNIIQVLLVLLDSDCSDDIFKRKLNVKSVTVMQFNTF